MRSAALAGLAVLVALPFAAYAVWFGIRGMTGDLSGESYLFAAGPGAASAGLALHMLAGGLLTGLVPLQLIGPLRARWPGLHRVAGRGFLAAGMVASLGGLVFIAAQGTIGGAAMDAGFALYGLLLALAACGTWRAARARDISRHRRWALRFVLLAMGSLLFRLHYVLWFLATGGIGSTEDLTGPFDRVQVFAFYLPYLAALELWLRRVPLRSRRARTNRRS